MYLFYKLNNIFILFFHKDIKKDKIINYFLITIIH